MSAVREMEEEMDNSVVLTNEEKKKKLATRIKIGIGVLGVLLVAPVTYFILQGLLGIAALAVAGLTAFVVIQLAPVFSMKLANWRMQMIVGEAEKNPIETMNNERIVTETMLGTKDKEIIEFETEVMNFDDETADFKTKYPEEAPAYESISKVMHDGLEDMKMKQEAAYADLEILIEAINKAKAIYKMAMAVERVKKLSESVEAQVFADIKQKVAFDAVRSQLNRSVAALNNSVGRRKEIRSQYNALPSPTPTLEINALSPKKEELRR